MCKCGAMIVWLSCINFCPVGRGGVTQSRMLNWMWALTWDKIHSLCFIILTTEKLAQTLEIRDQEESELILSSIPHHLSPSVESSTAIVPAHSHTVDSLTHHVEVQVLESGQVAMSSTAVTCEPITEPTTIVARDSLSVVEDTQIKTPVPPSVHSNTQSRKGLSAGMRRRQPNGGSCLSRAVPGDEVEVDGQFDMPIPDTSTTGVATTGGSTLMTFVMTSEGLSQTMSAEEEKHQQQCGSSDSSLSLQQDPSSRTIYQTPGPTAKTTPPAAANTTPPIAPTSTERMEPVKQNVSVDAATQTTNGQLRPGIHDRTPLIIRRRQVGKAQKLASSSKKQLQPTPSVGKPNALKLVKSSTGNGNETAAPARQEVQVQTQSPSEIETSTLVQVTEPHMETRVNEQGKQVGTHTPRRSSRKSAHKVSPSNEPVTMEESSSPARRTSPRKSPAQSSNDKPLTTPRIRTRALTKRTALEVPSEKEDVPLAKRTRKAVQEKSKESEEEEKLEHPQRWRVEEVVKYITSIQSDCASVFREHVSHVIATLLDLKIYTFSLFVHSYKNMDFQ